jgi:thiol-disulfide isomerase/thioredoxin
MIAPIIDEISSEYKDKLKCVKLNTDESPQVATDYGIRSIPTVSPAVTLGSDEQVHEMSLYRGHHGLLLATYRRL